MNSQLNSHPRSKPPLMELLDKDKLRNEELYHIANEIEFEYFKDKYREEKNYRKGDTKKVHRVL